MAASNNTSHRSHSQRFTQSYYLVWLDENINENDENCHNIIMNFKQIADTVETFIDVDDCIDFITDHSDEVIMIASKACALQLLPVATSIVQVKSIYIFGQNTTVHTTWTYKCSKIKGSFTDVGSICEILKETLKSHEHDEISISFAKSESQNSNTNKNTLDCSFMYTQILKEILLTIDFNDAHFNDFLTFCRTALAGNTRELRNVDRIQNEYRKREPIWWYTYESFLYSMLNKALRLMNIDILVKMAFFVCDLHKHITRLHGEQFNECTSSDSFIVYRGQGLSQADFDQLKDNTGGLLAFNNFLSTSKSRQVSLKFTERTVAKQDFVPVLFVMHIDPSITRTPFANVTATSAQRREEEILFSMHSVFRIGSVKVPDISGTLWEVKLTLTDENDPALYVLTQNVRNEIGGRTGWERLGQLITKLGMYDKAEEMYESLLRVTTPFADNTHLIHDLGMIYIHQGKYKEALHSTTKSVELLKNSLSPDHPQLAVSYNNIGLIYNYMGEYARALEYYQKSLEIRQKSLPPDHPDLAGSYNNIGLLYNNMGEYSKALEYYQKSLEIWKKSLSPDHPQLAASYNNIGSLYNNMGEYSRALEYYQKSLEIRQKSLPPDHPDLAESYNNIGLIYNYMGEYSKALEYYQKSCEIRQKSLPRDHPGLAGSYNNIGLIYNNMGEYARALEYYQKSLEIRQKSLPPDHPDLAGSYNNIGLIYNNMGEYSKALEYYQKSCEIRPKSFSPDHPQLAASYNNIGSLYNNMGEYSKALEYHQKSLGIQQKCLPSDHPDLAVSYNNIGLIYNNMGEYSKALEYYRKSLEIWKKSLSPDHPQLAASYNNIANVYRNMGEYSKALKNFELALDILQRVVPPNLSKIDTVKKVIGLMRNKM